MRVAVSGIGRKTNRSASGLPPQYPGLASTIRSRSSLTQETNRTGPLPTGFALNSSAPTRSKYDRGMIWPP